LGATPPGTLERPAGLDASLVPQPKLLPAAPAFVVLGSVAICTALALWVSAMSRIGLIPSLKAKERVVTTGAYRLVRHPICLGMILAALGGVFVYRTWTQLFLLVCSLGLLLRARRDEQALAARFGAAWRVYCDRVPALIPRPLLKK
jgi:protein-S-isoprenylcysteine O-methyltransferase Ste14